MKSSTHAMHLLSSSLERARTQQECILHGIQITAPALDPLSWFATIEDDAKGDARCILRSNDEQWVVAHSALMHHKSLKPCPDAPMTQFAKKLSAWRTQLNSDTLSAKEVIAVGGISFDPTQELSSMWREFGAIDFWLPSCWVRRKGCAHTLFALFSIDPKDTLKELGQRLHTRRACMMRWIERATAYNKADLHVSRETFGEVYEPDVEIWRKTVDETAQKLRAVNACADKIVLARTLEVRGVMPDAVTTLSRLREAYPECMLFAFRPERIGSQQAPSPVFLGATPELLVQKEGRTIKVDALAGSIPPEMDDEVLLCSPKNRREHQIVLEDIARTLKNVARLVYQDQPTLKRLRNVKHLHTPILGTLRSDECSIAHLGALLHPTPAVCGRPYHEACAWIATYEARIGFVRGWYAGAIGHATLDGDGALYVAIRSALLGKERADLFSGAGLVADSVGTVEVLETRDKAQALIQAILGA